MAKELLACGELIKRICDIFEAKANREMQELESANGGYGKGMELVGRFYNRGIYVKQDRRQAEYWLQRAMGSSDPDAVEEAKKEMNFAIENYF